MEEISIKKASILIFIGFNVSKIDNESLTAKNSFYLHFMSMESVNLRSFRHKARLHKSRLRRFLSKLEKTPPVALDKIASVVDKEVWGEVNCLSCANCCKQMSPTYSNSDIRRIASHLNMRVDDFKKKWLKKDRIGDWLNKTTPCQFLDLTTNMCGIYEVRPADCAGFPHLRKRKMVDYIHVHKQNLELCPATMSMVERMEKRMMKN